MKTSLGKKALIESMTAKIVLFVIALIIFLIIAAGVYVKISGGEGLLPNLFSTMKGGG